MKMYLSPTREKLEKAYEALLCHENNGSIYPFKVHRHYVYEQVRETLIALRQMLRMPVTVSMRDWGQFSPIDVMETKKRAEERLYPISSIVVAIKHQRKLRSRRKVFPLHAYSWQRQVSLQA